MRSTLSGDSVEHVIAMPVENSRKRRMDGDVRGSSSLRTPSSDPVNRRAPFVLARGMCPNVVKLLAELHSKLAASGGTCDDEATS
mmetsp:Transcript_80028/g.93499  ORF Transcript_80028/g.93499 Transcript_80028/m.93499 type:complete len:85 (-) Transcript_80028:175-429(-)